jgi:hypothetical protein
MRANSLPHLFGFPGLSIQHPALSFLGSEQDLVSNITGFMNTVTPQRRLSLPSGSVEVRFVSGEELRQENSRLKARLDKMREAREAEEKELDDMMSMMNYLMEKRGMKEPSLSLDMLVDMDK